MGSPARAPRVSQRTRLAASIGYFSRAAAELALTQPAVSQQIRALELQLGERLIERGPGSFALTEHGALLLEHADALWERLRLAETQLGEPIAGGRRRLRIGAFPSVLATLVPAAIAGLHQSVEDLVVSVLQGGTDELVTGVRDGSLHVAICFQDAAAPRREHAGARRHDLLEEPMLAAVGPDHPLAGRSRVRLSELRDDAWLAAIPDGLIVHACTSAGFEPRLAYLTGDPLAIRGLVTAGLAVTLVSRLLAEHLPGISTLQLAGKPAGRVIYAVTPSSGSPPLVASFLAAVRREAAQ